LGNPADQILSRTKARYHSRDNAAVIQFAWRISGVVSASSAARLLSGRIGAGEKTEACLTAGQIESIALVYQDHAYPFSLADGLPASYPRFGRGGAPSGVWVEQQQVPDGHVAAKLQEGSSSAQFERLVCEFPAYPHYDGDGDPERADSFRCIVHQ
jgi:hypothetical protein